MNNHPIKNRGYLILGITLVAIILLGASCTKKAAEKAAEKSIESASNNQADVDIDNDQVTVNTNAGSWQAGESVSLPSNFPDDIYIISGTIKTALALTENEGFSVSIESAVSLSQAKSTYESELAEAGWTVDSTYSTATGTIMSAQKSDRITTVSLSETDGQTTVVISTGRASTSN